MLRGLNRNNHFNVATLVENVDAHVAGVTLEQEIHPTVIDAKIINANFAKEFRQVRLVE